MLETDVYCPVCDFAFPELCRDSLNHYPVVDPECPGCGCRNISEFGKRVIREAVDPADWWKN